MKIYLNKFDDFGKARDRQGDDHVLKFIDKED